MKMDASPLSTLTLPMTLPVRPQGREVVVFKQNQPPKVLPGGRLTLSESPLKQIITDINSRAISPREIQELSLDLYANAIITWEEHEDLAFQVDLHPDFGKTIGALTGERPLPDQPRDYVKEWEQRLDFERRHAPHSPKYGRALRILSVLRRIDSPLHVVSKS
jgi:hypothetical protein